MLHSHPYLKVVGPDIEVTHRAQIILSILIERQDVEMEVDGIHRHAVLAGVVL